MGNITAPADFVRAVAGPPAQTTDVLRELVPIESDDEVHAILQPSNIVENNELNFFQLLVKGNHYGNAVDFKLYRPGRRRRVNRLVASARRHAEGVFNRRNNIDIFCHRRLGPTYTYSSCGVVRSSGWFPRKNTFYDNDDTELGSIEFSYHQQSLMTFSFKFIQPTEIHPDDFLKCLNVTPLLPELQGLILSFLLPHEYLPKVPESSDSSSRQYGCIRPASSKSTTENPRCLHYRSVRPRWNHALGSFTLALQGRALESSVYNCQVRIVKDPSKSDPDDENIGQEMPSNVILQIGRVGMTEEHGAAAHVFNLDFKYLSIFQAMSIAVSIISRHGLFD